MSDLGIVLIGVSIVIGLYFAFKYFVKTTTIVLLFIIIGVLIWDYQVSKFPIYDLSITPQGYFDQQRDIIPADQDQYIKLFNVINDYVLVTSGSNNGTGDEISKIDKKILDYNNLINDYIDVTNKTGLELNTFFKNKSFNILSMEKELLNKTDIALLEGILSTGNWGNLDPSMEIEIQAKDFGEGSPKLIRSLVMIGGTYCYMYSLQQTGFNNELLENKCINYFDQASKIAYRQHERKGGSLSKLVALVNIKTILSSVNNLRFEKIPSNLKVKIKENLKFLGNRNEEELIKNYKIDEYNTIFISTINEVIDRAKEKNGITDSILVSSALEKANNEIIIKTKNKSLELGRYFFTLKDANKPIDDLGTFLWRYEKSPSRYLLNIFGLDEGEFVSNSLSAELIITFIPRLTGIEKQYKELKGMYLEYIK